MPQAIRDFLRDLLVQGAAIREDFKGEDLVPGFKNRVEAAADERMTEFAKTLHASRALHCDALLNIVLERGIIDTDEDGAIHICLPLQTDPWDESKAPTYVYSAEKTPFLADEERARLLYELEPIGPIRDKATIAKALEWLLTLERK